MGREPPATDSPNVQRFPLMICLLHGGDYVTEQRCPQIKGTDLPCWAFFQGCELRGCQGTDINLRVGV